jgi:uncharacterized protein
MDSTSFSLCTSCGLCCNGSLFERVYLQPADDLKTIHRSPIKLKGHSPHQYFKQPCQCLNSARACTAYANRPLRCRLFSCKILIKLTANDILYSDAALMIDSIVKQTQDFLDLMALLGCNDNHKPLAVRYNQLMQSPLDSTELEKLTRSWIQLQSDYDTHLRVDPLSLVSS